MALGQRFKVLVLLPAIALAIVVAVGSGIAFSEAPTTLGLTAVGTIVGLQIGYLLGLGIRHRLIVVRAGKGRAASFANSAPARRPAH
jgi:hypothetical protein